MVRIDQFELSCSKFGVSSDRHKVSVIIPLFNKARWIARCLNSVLASTYPALELVLVDDCSSDESGQIAAGLLNASARFPWKIHRLASNVGAGLARNIGGDLCTGEFVYFLDADDEVHPEGISRLVACFRGNDLTSKVSFGAAKTFHEEEASGQRVDSGTSVWPSVAENPIGPLLAVLLQDSGSLWATGAMMIRREHFIRLGGYNPGKRIGEDRELMLKLLLLGGVLWVGSNSPVLTVNRVAGSAWRPNVVRDGIRDALGNLDALEWAKSRPDVVESERQALILIAAASVRKVLVMLRWCDNRLAIVKFMFRVIKRSPRLVFCREIVANLLYGVLGVRRGLSDSANGYE